MRGVKTGGERINGERTRGERINGTKAQGERITCANLRNSIGRNCAFAEILISEFFSGRALLDNPAHRNPESLKNVGFDWMWNIN
jgi:hypothetical protein